MEKLDLLKFWRVFVRRGNFLVMGIALAVM